MPLFQPGLCSVTFRDLPPERVIELAAKAGLAAIEWAGDVHVPPGAPQARHIAAATRDAGLSVSSYGSYLRAGVSSHDDLAAVIETAVTLNAPMIRVWAGARNQPSAGYDADARRGVAEWLDIAGATARAQGVAIGLEFHPGTLTDTLASASRLMEDITDENVYLYWQPRPGLARAPGIEEVTSIGAHVAHLHVFAWDTSSNRYPLHSQAEDWHAWIAALPSGRWTGPRYAMLEFLQDDDPAALMADADALKGQILGQDQGQ